MELAQDLKAIHGLDAETELANILSAEILSEINREVVRTIYATSKKGAANDTATAGIFDMDVDSNGRWSVEKFKGLMFQVERDANAIAQETRRGKGNVIICSSDVASALQMGRCTRLHTCLNNNLNVDDAGNTFAGVLNGRYKVYIDPYSANTADKQFYVVGYKGTSPYDAGIFYCPYVPLQMVRAVGEQTFRQRLVSRHVTVLLPILLQKVSPLAVVLLLQTQTLTTEKFKLRTSCNKSCDKQPELGEASISPFFIRINNVKEEKYGCIQSTTKTS